MEITKVKLYQVLDKLSMILLCTLMVDVCILGHLKLFDVGFFGNRMTLLLALIVVSIPQMIMNFKNVIKNKFVVMILAFGVWILFSAILGIINKNNMNILITDVKGYFYFVFIPVALCVLNTKERIHTLMKVLMYATIGISIIHLSHLIIYLVAPKTFNYLLVFGMKTDFSIIGSVTPKIPRIFIANVMYLLCGVAFPLYFYIEEKELSKSNIIIYPLICGFSIFSMMISYTRSVYLGAFITLFGCIMTYIMRTSTKIVKRLFTYLFVSVVAFLVVVSSFNISQKTDYLSFAFIRTFATFSDSNTNDTDDNPDGTVDSSDEELNETDNDDEFAHYIDETKNSDKLRTTTVSELIENIKSSPIVGHGLGKGLMVRGNGEEMNEYFYLDIMSKTGIVGLILFLFPAIYMVFSLFFKKGKRFNLAKVWLSVLLGFMIFSYFNPYMPGSLGILMYCCTISAFATCAKLDSEN